MLFGRYRCWYGNIVFNGSENNDLVEEGNVK